MSKKVTKEEYIKRWNSHISELAFLAFSLSGSDAERLFTAIGELEDLVKVAADSTYAMPESEA